MLHLLFVRINDILMTFCTMIVAIVRFRAYLNMHPDGVDPIAAAAMLVDVLFKFHADDASLTLRTSCKYPSYYFRTLYLCLIAFLYSAVMSLDLRVVFQDQKILLNTSPLL